jgi:hypothetical protein
MTLRFWELINCRKANAPSKPKGIKSDAHVEILKKGLKTTRFRGLLGLDPANPKALMKRVEERQGDLCLYGTQIADNRSTCRPARTSRISDCAIACSW